MIITENPSSSLSLLISSREDEILNLSSSGSSFPNENDRFDLDLLALVVSFEFEFGFELRVLLFHSYLETSSLLSVSITDTKPDFVEISVALNSNSSWNPRVTRTNRQCEEYPEDNGSDETRGGS
jgi:hypothetical protein